MKRGLTAGFIFAFFLLGAIVPALAASVGPIELSLEDCIRLGVAGNLGMLKKQLEKEGKKFDIETARKVYVPTGGLLIQESEEGRRTRLYQQSIAKVTRQGTRISLRNEIKDGVDPLGKDVNSQVFTLTQPLLKNFGGRVTGYEIDLARIDYDIAIEKFKSDLNAFVFDLTSLYLDLCYARRNLAIQEQACERARKQFEDTRHDIDLGAIAEREIYLVEENLVAFEIKQANARNDISRLDLELRRMLAFAWDLETPVTIADTLRNPNASETASFPVDVGTALAGNPDLHMERLLLQRSITTLEYQRVQTNPRLDVSFDYRWHEGRGSAQPNSYLVGVQYEVPLSRDADRALVNQSKLNTEIRRLSIKDSELKLGYSLKETFLQIEHLESIHKAKERAIELSQKKLAAETEKYKNGFSTLADVVRFQKELEDSMIEEISTLVSLQRFRFRRLLLEGTLYQKFGIAIGS